MEWTDLRGCVCWRHGPHSGERGRDGCLSLASESQTAAADAPSAWCPRPWSQAGHTPRAQLLTISWDRWFCPAEEILPAHPRGCMRITRSHVTHTAGAQSVHGPGCQALNVWLARAAWMEKRGDLANKRQRAPMCLTFPSGAALGFKARLPRPFCNLSGRACEHCPALL